VLPDGSGPVHQVLCAVYRFLVTSEQTGGAFALIEVVSPGSSAVPLHVHQREDETFFMLEGRLKVFCAGNTTVLERNATAFLPRGIPHSYSNPDETPTKSLVLITPGGFEKCLTEFGGFPAGQPPQFDKLVSIGKKYGLEFPAPA